LKKNKNKDKNRNKKMIDEDKSNFKRSQTSSKRERSIKKVREK
jgi:hypothetical protein